VVWIAAVTVSADRGGRNRHARNLPARIEQQTHSAQTVRGRFHAGRQFAIEVKDDVRWRNLPPRRGDARGKRTCRTGLGLSEDPADHARLDTVDGSGRVGQASARGRQLGSP
jgi:hypothetical protein